MRFIRFGSSAINSADETDAAGARCTADEFVDGVAQENALTDAKIRRLVGMMRRTRDRRSAEAMRTFRDFQ
jgi:hypothetical protein